MLSSPNPLGAQPLPPPDALEQAAWVQAVAQQADRVAFASLFQHFAPRIKAYLLRAGVAQGLADELAQEAMVNVWRKAASFDAGKASVSTWIFTIARNLRIDQLREGEEALHDVLEAALEQADDSPGALEQLAAAQSASAVRLAMAELPPEQLDILRRSFFDEQPHAAISAALGVPLGTVKSRIRLAVAHLRERLRHHAPS